MHHCWYICHLKPLPVPFQSFGALNCICMSDYGKVAPVCNSRLSVVVFFLLFFLLGAQGQFVDAEERWLTVGSFTSCRYIVVQWLRLPCELMFPLLKPALSYSSASLSSVLQSTRALDRHVSKLHFVAILKQ